MKIAASIIALVLMSQAASATLPRGYVSSAVRSTQVAQQRAAEAAAAQARANATGQPQYANGGVYIPVKP